MLICISNFINFSSDQKYKIVREIDGIVRA